MADIFQEIAKQRSDIYGFISGIFRQELNCDQLKEMLSSGVLKMLIHGGANINLDFFNRPIELIEEELAVEYTALFIGPDKHISLYESIYIPDSTGKAGQYWGECTSDMKNWVEHYGLKVSEKFESIPDHVSIELEFMKKIIEQEFLAWEKGDTETARKCIEVEKTFFKKHIVKWLPLFFDKITESANLDFYREMAKIGKDFILDEETLLNAKENSLVSKN